MADLPPPRSSAQGVSGAGVPGENSSSTASGSSVTQTTDDSADLQAGTSARRREPKERVANYSRCIQEPPGVESGDYDLHECLQYISLFEGQQEALKRYSLCPRTLGRTGRRWILVIVAGIGAGLVATVIDQVTHFVVRGRLLAMEHLVGREQPLIVQYLVFLTCSLSLLSMAGLMVCFVEPLAAGSGIPEIKCFLNGTHLPRVLDVRTLAAKVFGIICSVSAGMPAGKEGPMIHSGAIMGSLVSQPFSCPLLQPKSFDRERRDLVAAGAAAGVAAAFSAPLGGVLFAIEEGASWMNVTIMLRTFVCALTATFTQRLFAGGFEGDGWAWLGFGGYPLEFGHLPRLEYRVYDLPVIAAVAVFCGMLGMIWNTLNIRLARWRKTYIGQMGCKRWVEAMLAGVVIFTLNFWAPVAVLGSTQDGLSDEGVLQWGVQSHVIKLLFISKDHFDPLALLTLAVVHFLTGCWAFGLGIPCGIFVPTLLSGAAVGRLIGQGLFAAGYFGNELAHEEIGAFALIGAAGLLSGVARITISLSVILMEAVQNQTFALPLFMTTLISKQVGNTFNEGIYDMLIKLRGIPLMELGVVKSSIRREAREVMATELVTLEPVEEVQSLFAKLERCKHNAFPVVDDTGIFLGLVRRRMLEQVLAAHRAPRCSLFQEVDKPLASPAPVVPFEGLAAIEHLNGLDLARGALREGDLHRRVDLQPFINDVCYTVPENTSLLRCYELFRTMGLRHLPVVSRSGALKGILTRKDLIFADEFLHAAGGHHAVVKGAPEPDHAVAHPVEAIGSPPWPAAQGRPTSRAGRDKDESEAALERVVPV